MNLKIQRKLILICTFLLSILGLIKELIPYKYIVTTPENYFEIDRVRNFIGTIDLYFFSNFPFQFRHFDSQLTSNSLNLIFHAILLLGGILYLYRSKEIRLLRFSYALFFFYWISAAVIIIIMLVLGRLNFAWFWFAPFLVKSVLILLSYYIIKSLTRERVTQNAIQEQSVATYWVRLFHLFVDGFLCFFLLSVYAFSFEDVLSGLSRAYGERAMMSILFVPFSIMYYLLFETIFHNTPAKFLTESKIVSTTNQKLGVKNMFIRTFTRQVPLNPLSFLVTDGWHDMWSKTKVVSENPQGSIPGKKYFLIIPLFIVLGYGLKWSTDYFKTQRYRDKEEKLHDFRVQHIDLKLQKGLMPEDMISFKEYNSTSTAMDYFFRISEVGQTEVKGMKIKRNYKDVPTVYQAEKQYQLHKDTAQTYTISFDQIKKAIPRTYEYDSDYEDYGTDFFSDKKLYTIYSIRNTHLPEIDETIYGGMRGSEIPYRSKIDFELTNTGTPSNLISIENIEGNIDWSAMELPLFVSSEEGYDRNLTLKGDNYTRGTFYKFIISLQSLEKGHQITKYVIEGKNLDRSIVEMK